MYEGAKTWSIFVGCEFGCMYCGKSFRRQAKRQKRRCELCYEYKPHAHLERLDRIPSKKIVFACGMGDVAFAEMDVISKIMDKVKDVKGKTFLFQSKDPETFVRWEREGMEIPENVVLGTTIETNMDFVHVVIVDTVYGMKYEKITRAPHPKKRYESMMKIEHGRKFVTIEPIMNFDLDVMVEWIRDISPEFVYVGYDNHGYKLPEPPVKKTEALIDGISRFTEVIRKTIRPAWWEIS